MSHLIYLFVATFIFCALFEGGAKALEKSKIYPDRLLDSIPKALTDDLHHVGESRNISIPNTDTDYFRRIPEVTRSLYETDEHNLRERRKLYKRNSSPRQKRQSSMDFLYVKLPHHYTDTRESGYPATMKLTNESGSIVSRESNSSVLENGDTGVPDPLPNLEFLEAGRVSPSSSNFDEPRLRPLQPLLTDDEISLLKKSLAQLNLKTGFSLGQYVKLREKFEFVNSKSALSTTSLKGSKLFKRAMRQIKLRIQALDEDAIRLCATREYPIELCVRFSFVAFWREVQMINITARYYLQELSYSSKSQDVIQEDVESLEYRHKALSAVEFFQWKEEPRATQIPGLLEDISLMVTDLRSILRSRGNWVEEEEYFNDWWNNKNVPNI